MPSPTPMRKDYSHIIRWPGDAPPAETSGGDALGCLGMVVIFVGMMSFALVANFSVTSLALPGIGLLVAFLVVLLVGGAQREQKDDEAPEGLLIAGAPAAATPPFGMRAVMISFTVFSLVVGIFSMFSEPWLAGLLGLIGAIVALNACRATQT